MCQSLKIIYQPGPVGWLSTEVPCGKCWSCRQQKINDIVGRCLMENAYSAWSCALTLTYRDQPDFSHKIVNKRHFQDFVRALRKRGHLVRYLAAGEYGERKGRAHFHCVLFGRGDKPPPEIPQTKRAWVEEWPHGHVFADWAVGHQSIRYTAKYVIKEWGGEWMSRSTKPLLGAAFIEAYAQRYADAGVLPRGFNYMPPGGVPEYRYSFSGAAERTFLEALFRRAPQLADQETTMWMEGALLRLAKYRARVGWAALPDVEQTKIIVDQMGALRQAFQQRSYIASLSNENFRLYRQKLENRYGSEKLWKEGRDPVFPEGQYH